MNTHSDLRERLMKIYLYTFGIASVFIITTIPIIWGDLFLWQPRNLPTEIMMAGLYLSMGIMMILVAKYPLSQKSFIDFLILANLLHALIMLVLAQNIYQIILDVIPIGLMGAIPLIIYPWGYRNLLQVLRKQDFQI